MNTSDTLDCVTARFDRLGQTTVDSAHGQWVLRQLTAHPRLTPDPRAPHQRPPEALATSSGLGTSECPAPWSCSPP